MRSNFTGDPAVDAIITREIRYGESRWSEIWASMIMTLFGCVLLADGDTFAISKSFGVIREFVDEDAAGVIALAVGAVRLVALYVNGNHYRSPLVRVAGCAGGFLFWSAIAAGFFLTAPPYTTGLAVYPILALAELHSSGRAARDAFVLDSLGTRQRGRKSVGTASVD